MITEDLNFLEGTPFLASQRKHWGGMNEYLGGDSIVCCCTWSISNKIFGESNSNFQKNTLFLKIKAIIHHHQEVHKQTEQAIHTSYTGLLNLLSILLRYNYTRFEIEEHIYLFRFWKQKKHNRLTFSHVSFVRDEYLFVSVKEKVSFSRGKVSFHRQHFS